MGGSLDSGDLKIKNEKYLCNSRNSDGAEGTIGGGASVEGNAGGGASFEGNVGGGAS